MLTWYEASTPAKIVQFVNANPAIIVVDIEMTENTRWVLFYYP